MHMRLGCWMLDFNIHVHDIHSLFTWELDETRHQVIHNLGYQGCYPLRLGLPGTTWHILVGPMATPGIRNGAPNFHTKPLWRWFLMHIIVWKTWKCRKLSPFNFNIPFDHLHHHRSTSFGGSTTTLHSWVFPLPLWAI